MFKQFPLLSLVAVIFIATGIALIIYLALHTTAGIPVAISRVQSSWFANYAGFTDDKDNDAQVFSFGEVTITNTSTTEKVALDLFLHISAKDKAKNKTSIRLPANLIGPFHMIYGKDDKASKTFANAGFGEPRNLFRSPVELSPGQVSRKELVFVISIGRDAVLDIAINGQNYDFDLEIDNLISGRDITISIPGEYRG